MKKGTRKLMTGFRKSNSVMSGCHYKKGGSARKASADVSRKLKSKFGSKEYRNRIKNYGSY
jgi:hypothetical protein